MMWLIRALKHAMAFFCTAMGFVLLMDVVAVAEGTMTLLNGVIWFLICVLGTNFALGIWFKLDDKEHGKERGRHE